MADVQMVRVRNTETDREEEVREDMLPHLLASSSNWERVDARATKKG